MANSSTETLPSGGDIEKADSSRTSNELRKADVGEVETGRGDPFLVDTLSEDEDPKHLSFLRKIIIMFVMSLGALCSTFCSSIVR